MIQIYQTTWSFVLFEHFWCADVSVRRTSGFLAAAAVLSRLQGLRTANSFQRWKVGTGTVIASHWLL